eukprot:425668_1
MTDFFHSQFTHKSYTLGNNRSVVSKKRESIGAAYLEKIVKAGVHQWTFNLISYGGGPVSIGVWKNRCKIDINDSSLQQKGKQYSYLVTNGCLSKGDEGDGYHKNFSFNTQCVKGQIDMTLDLNRKQLKYKINNKELIAFRKIEKTEYMAAVCMYSESASIELISYQQITAENDGDGDDVMDESIDLTLNEQEKVKDDMDDDIKCGECEKLKAIITGLKNENEYLENDRNKKQKQIETLHQKMETIKALNSKLNEECKEFQIDLEEMKRKYNMLNRKMNIDESKYIEWNSDRITDWIIYLDDDQYVQYEDVLRRNLKKEDVDGSILGKLNNNDLHRFGIISMKHKLAVSEHIKRLTNPQHIEGDKNTEYI